MLEAVGHQPVENAKGDLELPDTVYSNPRKMRGSRSVSATGSCRWLPSLPETLRAELFARMTFLSTRHDLVDHDGEPDQESSTAEAKMERWQRWPSRRHHPHAGDCWTDLRAPGGLHRTGRDAVVSRENKSPQSRKAGPRYQASALRADPNPSLTAAAHAWPFARHVQGVDPARPACHPEPALRAKDLCHFARPVEKTSFIHCRFFAEFTLSGMKRILRGVYPERSEWASG